ncbi:hypothetical protein [Arcticibacter tournemirensis]|uniref:S1 motif domain-containing protein n=1 Tax=Arcticibacter tournemirensis TaxID=699437 RepID=A0A4Q0MBJ2_9SPHI|nr:hypothetical protein [Arcticibacter tournemirensis]RXF70534.1 hypothetical protein EKH83_07780 [Arcticibacter tournemirensis]
MIEDIFNYRHWAETARLYAGWLDKEQQTSFIKALAENNILLASECRANLFSQDTQLDDYLAEIAFKNTKDISKTKQTSAGLLALAVLDKYDLILKIFESKKAHSNDSFYSHIISDFISNASESHTLEFLKILSSSNIFLFDKALDNLIENSIVFTQESKGIALIILSNIGGVKNEVIRLKTICLFHLTNLLDNPKSAFYTLMNNKQFKYAYRLCTLSIIEVDSDILVLLNEMVEERKTQNLKIFLKILEKSKIDFDESLINLLLVKSLNPVIKRIALTTLNGDPIEREIAIKICRENIKIGNKSSIEFADEVINEFKLAEIFDRKDLVARLLKSHKYQSIELAYHFIKKYSLYKFFNFRKVLEILIGNISNESLLFSRLLIIEEFPANERNDMLKYICALSFKDERYSKIRKQILLNDLNKTENEHPLEKEYNGLSINSFKGYHQVSIGNSHPLIKVPYTQIRLKKDEYFKLKLEEVSENFSNSRIKYIGKNPIYEKVREIWHQNYYIGQFIEIHITSVNFKIAFGRVLNNENLTFVIPISEIDDSFIGDITKYIQVQKSYKVKIKSFNRKKDWIICSLRDLKIETSTDYEDKLQMLKEKYSK